MPRLAPLHRVLPAGLLLLASSGAASCGAAPPSTIELGAAPPAAALPAPDPPRASPKPSARPSPAPAPPPEPETEERRRAEALFEEGRALMTKGAYAEACARFAESHRLDPAIGTLFNLAACEELAGDTRGACAHFREAAAMAQSRGQTERERFVRDRLARLGCP